MSTAARKARKRAGIPFERVPKTGTPFERRRHFAGASLVSRVSQLVRRDGTVVAGAYLDKQTSRRAGRGSGPEYIGDRRASRPSNPVGVAR